jgi:hypothetical protein
LNSRTLSFYKANRRNLDFDLPPRPLLCATIFLAGCSFDSSSPGAIQLASLDFNDFACKVQPVTASRCSMLACHGQEGHAFRVYSPGKLRLQPATTLAGRDAPLRLPEAQANMASMVGLLQADRPVEESPLLRKPLAQVAGGGEHVGGIVFRTADDPNYRAIHAWLGGEVMAGGCSALDTINQNP